MLAAILGEMESEAITAVQSPCSAGLFPHLCALLIIIVLVHCPASPVFLRSLGQAALYHNRGEVPQNIRRVLVYSVVQGREEALPLLAMLYTVRLVVRG